MAQQGVWRELGVHEKAAGLSLLYAQQRTAVRALALLYEKNCELPPALFCITSTTRDTFASLLLGIYFTYNTPATYEVYLHIQHKEKKGPKANYGTGAAYLLDVDLNVLLQVVAIQVEHKVVHKVKAVTDDDQRQLVGQLGFLHAHKPIG